MYGYDVETKMQSSQWVGKSSPRPKKARQSRYNVKVMLIVFLLEGIVHHEFVPRGETVNKEFYLKVMKRLREAVRRKRPEAWTNKTWMLHHDDAPAHASLLIREFLAKQDTIVVPQRLLSRFGPCGRFPVPKVEVHPKSRRFQTIEEIKENSLQDLRAIPQNKFQNAFQNWKKNPGRVV